MEYLVNHGYAGELGRFATSNPFVCRHGDRVVVRGRNGLEIGVVKCSVTARLASLLEDGFVGELVRLVNTEDEAIIQGIQARSQHLFADARQLTTALNLPLEVLDVEIQFDGHRVTLFFLRWAECDERPLVRALSRQYEVMVALRDLAVPAGASACGRPDCSNGKEGGCTTCTSGGCATGCGSQIAGQELKDYFAGLRQQMEKRQRVPLI